jgi:hypothetical protein
MTYFVIGLLLGLGGPALFKQVWPWLKAKLTKKKRKARR